MPLRTPSSKIPVCGSRNIIDRCAIAVMAKAPQLGTVKTRLSTPPSPEEATVLSANFLRDTAENLAFAARYAPIDPYIAYAPARHAHLFDGLVCEGTRLILADGAKGVGPGVEGLGRSLLHA